VLDARIAEQKTAEVAKTGVGRDTAKLARRRRIELERQLKDVQGQLGKARDELMRAPPEAPVTHQDPMGPEPGIDRPAPEEAPGPPAPDPATGLINPVAPSPELSGLRTGAVELPPDGGARNLAPPAPASLRSAAGAPPQSPAAGGTGAEPPLTAGGGAGVRGATSGAPRLGKTGRKRRDAFTPAPPVPEAEPARRDLSEADVKDLERYHATLAENPEHAESLAGLERLTAKILGAKAEDLPERWHQQMAGVEERLAADPEDQRALAAQAKLEAYRRKWTRRQEEKRQEAQGIASREGQMPGWLADAVKRGRRRKGERKVTDEETQALVNIFSAGSQKGAEGRLAAQGVVGERLGKPLTGAALALQAQRAIRKMALAEPELFEGLQTAEDIRLAEVAAQAQALRERGAESGKMTDLGMSQAARRARENIAALDQEVEDARGQVERDAGQAGHEPDAAGRLAAETVHRGEAAGGLAHGAEEGVGPAAAAHPEAGPAPGAGAEAAPDVLTGKILASLDRAGPGERVSIAALVDAHGKEATRQALLALRRTGDVRLIAAGDRSKFSAKELSAMEGENESFVWAERTAAAPPAPGAGAGGAAPAEAPPGFFRTEAEASQSFKWGLFAPEHHLPKTKAGYAEQARAEGLDPEHLHALAAEMMRVHNEYVRHYNQASVDARSELTTYGNPRNIKREYIQDPKQIRGLDVVADSIEKRYPALVKPGEKFTDTLLQILKRPALDTMKREQAYEEALAELRERKEVQDVYEQAQQEGEEPAALEEALRAGAEHRGAEEEAGAAPADTGFDFGANAPAAGGPAPAAPAAAPGAGAGTQPPGGARAGAGVGSPEARVLEAFDRLNSSGGNLVGLAALGRVTGMGKAELHAAVESLRRQGVLTGVGLEGRGEHPDVRAWAIPEGDQQIAYVSRRPEAPPIGGGQPSPERAAAVDDLAQQMLAEQSGPGVAPPPGRLEQLKDYLHRAWDHVRHGFAEVAGRAYPRMHEADHVLGEKAMQHASAREFAKQLAPHMIDRVLGEGATEADAVRHGATYLEWRLRAIRDAAIEEANRLTAKAARLRAQAEQPLTAFAEAGIDPQVRDRIKKEARATEDAAREQFAAAERVGSVIGKERSPFKTEQEFQAALASPQFQSLLARWKQHMVPFMEEHYRKGQGMDPDDPIDSLTQTDPPVNLKPTRPGEKPTPTTVFTRKEGGAAGPGGEPTPGGFQGNLKNPTLRRSQFTRRATGAAEGYEMDLRAMIEHSIAESYSVSTKAEFYRQAVASGRGEFAPRGARVTLPDGSETREIPNVNPPRGTQPAAAGQTSFYIDKELYPEARKMLAVDQPARFPTLSALSSIFNSASLASTVEFAYHSKNLLTMLTRPYMVRSFLGAAHDVATGDAGARGELVELARIGAGYRSELPAHWGGDYNPMTWMGKFLQVTDKVMRLAAGRAFERMRAEGLPIDTEASKRDFINQLGQYNVRAQHGLIALLRETGIGPFATAGSNFWAQGMRSLTFSAGVKGTSPQAEARLRGEVLAKTVAVLGAAALANYVLWGRADGDDRTPLGAIKLSQADQMPRTMSLDLTNLVGVTRAARQVGALALLEGARGIPGPPPRETALDRATGDVLHALVHPAMGPPVAFAWTAATGRDTLGRHVAEKPAEKGGSHVGHNLAAALRHANPAYAGFTGASQPGKQVPLEERAAALAGPYGPKFRYARGYVRPPQPQ
jgi:hypothetical protein